MAQSAFIDYKRREKKHEETNKEPYSANGMDECPFELQALLEKMLNVLTPLQLSVFILIEEMKLTVKEVSAVLRTSEGAIKALLSRSRANTKKMNDEMLEQDQANRTEKVSSKFINDLMQAIKMGDAIGICRAYVDTMRAGYTFLEIERKMGGFSFCFRDPDGHILRIISIF
jgi:RNA polymerase sigma-70 factor (ECF subfamily)